MALNRIAAFKGGRRLHETGTGTNMTAATYADDGRLDHLVRTMRVPLRMFAAALTGFMFTSQLTVTSGVVAATLGAALSVPLAVLLGRFADDGTGTAVRRAWVVACLLGLVVLAAAASGMWLHWTAAASTLGPARMLWWYGWIRHGLMALGAFALLRVLALRRPGVAVVEVLVSMAALGWALAAHRDGIIARPLWLSDWAWRQGLEPTHVLAAIGAAAVIVHAVLIVLERRGSRPLSSALVMTTLVIGAVMLWRAYAPAQGDPLASRLEDGLGGRTEALGDPPRSAPNTEQSSDGRIDGEPSPSGDDAGGAGQQHPASDNDRGNLPPAQMGDENAAVGDDSTQSQAQGTSPNDNRDPNGGSGGAPNPVAVVVLENDYSPPSQGYYLRQDAWSQWNGHRLVPAGPRHPEADNDVAKGFPSDVLQVQPPPPAPDTAEPLRTQVSAKVALLTEHHAPFAIESPVRFTPLPNPNPDRFKRLYRVSSLAQTVPYESLFARKANEPAWSESTRALYLQPHPDPRFAQLADRIVQTLPEHLRPQPFARAVAIKLHLDKSLTYSTRERHADAEDPTVDFLFGNRTGYCVHFAHAAVFLLRSQGIAARVGTGYMVEEQARKGGSAFLVRNVDAHAWPELYVRDLGWVVLDIAPENNLDEAGEPVDDDLQRLLGEMVREQVGEEEPLEDERPFQWPQVLWRLLGFAALIAALVSTYGIKLGRRLWPYLCPTAQLPRATYRAALDRWAEYGLHRHEGQTREAFAAQHQRISPAFVSLTRWHVAAALAAPHHPVHTVPRREYLKTVHRTLRQISAHHSPWRRILAALHPVAFRFAR